MKKNFLFGLMAITLAVFGFGGVSIAADVAKIGETPYASLTNAINNAQNGDTVILLDDVSSSVSLTTDKSITLNLNGHKITIDSTAVSISAGTLTVEGNGSIDVTSKGANVFNVVGGKLIVKNGVFTGGGGVYVKGNSSEATIIDGRFIGLRSGNSALMHATNSGTLTIVSGYFEGAPTNNGKPQKVIYAGGNGNYCDSRSTIQSDPTYRIGGTVVVKGGILVGRVSLSNGGTYEIQGGIFTLYGDKTAGVNCDYSACTATIHTESGCYDVPGIVSMLNEGYVGISQGGGVYQVVYDPAATIGENGYSTVTGAIAAATAGQTVKILKAGTYPFPATISVANLTIKGNVDGVVFAHDYADNNGIISTIANGITFENVGFNLTNNSSNNANHYFKQTAGTIIMSGCTINGLIHTMGNMQFDNCTFTTNAGYNIWTQIGNITFNGGEIVNNGSSRLVNVYQHNGTNPSNSNRYTITFNGTKFTNNGSAGKGALNIHEVADQTTTYVLQYTINMNNVTTEGTFATNKPGYLPYFSVEDIIVGIVTAGVAAGFNGSPTAADVSDGTSNGGDIVVKVDGVTKYSTPKVGQSQRTVTFDGTNTGVVNDGDKIEQPANPAAQNCKAFVEWQLNGVTYDFNSVVTGNIALTSKWNSTCGGGSSTSSSSSNKTGDANTGTNNTGTNNTGTVETGTNNNEETVNPTDPQAVQENGFTKEFNNAYEFAFANGITTMKSIEEAAMDEGLNRIAMAKMLSQYAINVLKKTPDTSKECKFGDVPAELDAEYANGVTLACQLGIMGVGITDFRPFDPVVRAEFGTALSRLLFGIEDGEDAYYTTHLAKLKEAGIISNDDPTLEELRGYVMLMLMRSAK